MAKTFKEVVFEHWIPPVITAVVGGFMVSIAIWNIQESNSIETALAEKRLQTYQRLTEAAVIYTSKLQNYKNYALTPLEEISQDDVEFYRQVLAQARSDVERSHEELIRVLPTAYVFFGDNVQIEVGAFEEWVRMSQKSTPDQLPSDSDILLTRDELVSALRSEIGL